MFPASASPNSLPPPITQKNAANALRAHEYLTQPPPRFHAPRRVFTVLLHVYSKADKVQTDRIEGIGAFGFGKGEGAWRER